MVPIQCGFTSDSSGDTMCNIVSVVISNSALTICIRNFGTSDASLKPVVQVLRVKGI